DGVRRAVASQAGVAPAAPAAATVPSTPPATGRGDTIRARLAQLPTERQALEDQRLGAMMKFELSRAAQIQTQIQALDTEKATLERELATLPATPSASPTTTPPAAPAADPAFSVRCQDVPATLDSALKIRRRELGAREEQAGAIPLVAIKGQTPEQVGQELAAQFPAGATPGAHVGLMDADGNKQIDGFVDMPAAGIFRLVHQRADGSLAIAVFPAPGSAGTAAYGEMMRRLDESSARQAGLGLADLLAVRPASAPRVTMQTADFATAYAPFQAGNFAESARLATAAVRSIEFQNLRGQAVRVLDVIGPVANGVSLRRVVVLAQPNDQETWEESTTVVRPTYLKTDVEVTRSRETRSTSGTLVGAPSASKPSTFTLER
ncbi:MAG TPA: hypothetical protein VFL90_05660, partial [Methylomirabilota bacterium]|nr:hypothetical protein [Methylomirabilota bacterium]